MSTHKSARALRVRSVYSQTDSVAWQALFAILEQCDHIKSQSSGPSSTAREEGEAPPQGMTARKGTGAEQNDEHDAVSSN